MKETVRTGGLKRFEYTENSELEDTESTKEFKEGLRELREIRKSKKNLLDKIKCFFGFHKWKKFMNPEYDKNGKCIQNFVCHRCGKIKKVIK